MHIENSRIEDVSKIIELYQLATTYMKSKNQVHWPEFPLSLITTEIAELRQWKLIIENQIACIWATTLNDEVIWGHIDNSPSLYLHRIATHPKFRGRKLVNEVINWADEYCKRQKLKFIRMDTVGLNHGLIKHYQQFGFKFLESRKLDSTEGLPQHYNKGEVCYFQRELSPSGNQ